jgi:hypothetical protein
LWINDGAWGRRGRTCPSNVSRTIWSVLFKAEADEKGLEAADEEPKSPEAKAFKLFSEGKTPIEVAIALDLDAGRVRAIYYDYWELKGMFKLAEIYIELGRDDLLSLIRLHKIFKHLGMKEHDMFKVLELAKDIYIENFVCIFFLPRSLLYNSC